MFHGVNMCSLLISRRESLHLLKNHGMEVFTDLPNMIRFMPRVKNSRMEWTGVEFEIHALKTLILAPWPRKKFTVLSEIHTPPFRWWPHWIPPWYPSSDPSWDGNTPFHKLISIKTKNNAKQRNKEKANKQPSLVGSVLRVLFFVCLFDALWMPSIKLISSFKY